MNVLEAIQSRRSIRAFRDEPVPTEIIEELITLGTRAATASNNQPWGFVVITDRAEMKRLSDTSRDHWLANLETYPFMKQYLNLLTKKNYNMFYNAQCLLVIYGDARAYRYEKDCTLAAANIMLAAKEYGLGTCWIGNAENVCETEEFKLKYHVPPQYKVVCPMIIGYPRAELPPSMRRPVRVFNK